ncbi:MAG: hypothetical protein H6707_04650 [Deltaproteobacteria bacterium]|nr:hypothetical protein [Deltaproteobacteria bacterium]
MPLKRQAVITALLVFALGAELAAQPTPAASQPSEPVAYPTLRKFSSAQEALRYVLRRKPALIGVGEYHQKHESVRVASSLRRFTRELFSRLLDRRTSDLVIETWITKGDCGSSEKAVVKDVEETTKRPAQTEDEILTLVKRARHKLVKPHILEMTCADYRRLLSGQEGVNYDTFLKMTADQLREKLLAIHHVRSDPIKRAVEDASVAMWRGKGDRGRRDLVLAYGGALHNDRYPTTGIEHYSYGPAMIKALGDRYLELDLFVPEYIEGDQTLLQKQAWFAPFLKQQSRRKVLLFERAKNAFVLIFKRQRKSRSK